MSTEKSIGRIATNATDSPEADSFRKKEVKKPETQTFEDEDSIRGEYPWINKSVSGSTKATLEVVPIQTIRIMIASLVKE